MKFYVDLKMVQLAHVRMLGYQHLKTIKGYTIYRRPDGGSIQYLGENKWTIWRDGSDEPPVDRIVRELNEWKT